jgi:hypothetical protein
MAMGEANAALRDVLPQERDIFIDQGWVLIEGSKKNSAS